MYLQKFLFTALTILFFFISLFVYTKLVGPIPFNVDSVVTTKLDSYTVTGEGKATIKPDLAVINLGVTTKGDTAQAAQNSMDEQIHQVIASIKQLGISENDIKTQNYSVNPNYDYNNSTQKITNYSASTNLTITVKNIDLVNNLIETASSNGANQIGGVSFSSKNSKTAEEQARKEAVNNAKSQAEQASRIAGFKLGRLINYSESNQGPVGSYDVARMETVSSLKNAPDIQPGENEIVVVVTLSYEIN